MTGSDQASDTGTEGIRMRMQVQMGMSLKEGKLAISLRAYATSEYRQTPGSCLILSAFSIAAKVSLLD